MDTGMNEAAKLLIVAEAETKAAKRVLAAKLTIAAGSKKFVKGKPTMVPMTERAICALRAIQEFSADFAVQHKVAAIVDAVDPAATEAEFDEYVEIYCAAGNRIVKEW
jgi:hypothetical protein